MQKLGLNEIREKYLSFFESKEHLRLPSFSLVPQNDASLLLINAGMAPLKPYFTGKEIPPKNRVTTCQKCIRTPDIERVGKTARHGTFFEMLGNFSFGDYFKNEATAWAWEFATSVMEMPIDKLWVSIYLDDDEAYDIWTKNVGVSKERVVRMGKEDNFWEIGTGPCGPCSEIYFDRGVENGCGSSDCKVGCDCDRFVEFWNLVFTQLNKDENGNYNKLPKPNIDTGMGLERLAAVIQGVNNIFEVDTIKNIMIEISIVANVKYNVNEKTDVSLRVITDHIRSTVFLISDGVLPSNEGRGYVLRRLLRRAARHGKLLGITEPFLYNIADTVIGKSFEAYPELKSRSTYIKKVIKVEEERFNETIDSGICILQEYINDIKSNNLKVLDGERAFKLYDTYGFPIDLTMEITEEQKIDVDLKGFETEMELQRNRARDARHDNAGAGWDDDVFSKMKNISTEFIGYENTQCNAKVIAIVKDNEFVEFAATDDNVIILTDMTVFYGESGGQIGDSGIIENENIRMLVNGTKKTADGKYLHLAYIENGTLTLNDSVIMKIDTNKRNAIMRNHSTTHLLHKALKQVLGDHIAQAGSFVTDERLRFDFTHFEAITPTELKDVELKVNNAILSAMPIKTQSMNINDAKKTGAEALFGEKYGNTVRVVTMGDYSLEFCGGTHLSNTSHAGLFKILSETGVAAGTRRIEAVTGFGVLEYLDGRDDLLSETAKILKTGNVQELPQKAAAFVSELKESQKKMSALKEKAASGAINEILNDYKEINGIKLVVAKQSGKSIEELRQMGDKIKEQLQGSTLVVLASVNEDNINFITMATKEAVEKGIHAGNIIKQVAAIAGGTGGGRPDSAQAGGRLKEKVDVALATVESLIK